MADLQQALTHVAGLYAEHAPAVVAQRLEITEGLRLLEDPKREVLAGNRQVIWIVADQLEEDARVGAALVQLTGRVQVAWPVAHRRCHLGPVTDGEPDRVERAVVLRFGRDEGKQCHVVAGANLAEQGLDRRLESRSRLAGPPDPLADGRRIALAEDSLGEVLCLLNVRLVEDVDAEDRASHRDRILPPEELRPDGERIAELERHNRLPRLPERLPRA